MKFTIGQILSIHTGKLMCDIGAVYEILNFLHSDNLFTHQLPRASRDAGPWIVESLPWLKDITCEEVTPANVVERLKYYQRTLGLEHALSPIPGRELLHRDPITEAEEMAPGRVMLIDGGTDSLPEEETA